MKEINFVNPEKIETLEDYGASIISSLITLETLLRFENSAYKIGLFNTDEEELSKTICWEIGRLSSLYQKQLNNILERTELDEKKALDCLKKIAAPLKVKKQKK